MDTAASKKMGRQGHTILCRLHVEDKNIYISKNTYSSHNDDGNNQKLMILPLQPSWQLKEAHVYENNNMARKNGT
jgi:hypothetical protein